MLGQGYPTYLNLFLYILSADNRDLEQKEVRFIVE